jgi:putative transposase
MAHGDMATARSFFDKAVTANRAPGQVSMKKSGANKAAIDNINHRRTVPITVCQIKYLNNIVELNHRAIKRLTRPMLSFK